MVSTSIKRLWLRRIYAQTTAGGGTTYATLAEALQAYAFVALDAIKGGTIASTSANNHAVAFSNRDNGATPDDVAAMAGEMLDLYDTAEAALIATGITSPTDAQIKTEMLDRLQVVTDFSPQFINIRRSA